MAEFQGLDDRDEAVLLVGLVCVDFILTCSHYPLEDSSNRALDFAKRRGGNASNSCTVFSQLNTKCEILATLGGDESAKFLMKDLEEHGVSFKYSSVYPLCKTPFTNIIISQRTGSRTGVHFRGDLPENSLSDFCKVDLCQYNWIHFEGRCAIETLQMMSYIDDWNTKRRCKANKLRYSVELEKCKEETKQFIPAADYVFVSKDFAQYMGFNDMLATVNGISSLAKTGAVVIVPWGDQGAMARCANGEIVTSKAYPPLEILDSIGAGDTFIAATITFLSKQKSVKAAIEFGCKVAGAKVGFTGFTGLRAKFCNIGEGATE